MMRLFLFIFLPFILQACSGSRADFDASGIFEAEEVIISSELSGQLLYFLPEEGMHLLAGQTVGRIDCEGLQLQKEQAEAGLGGLYEKKAEAGPQVSVLEEQLNAQESQIEVLREELRVLQREEQRLQNLVEADAAPSKKLDDLSGNVKVLEKKIAAGEHQQKVIRQQIEAHRRSVAIQNRGLLSEEEPMRKQVARLADQLQRCTLTNPMAGTVLLTYAEEYEMAAPGKPLYKIAKLDTMLLRAYVTGDQLSGLQLGQRVEVLVDDGGNAYRRLPGHISWIAEEAEFTPKTIQTREERANLVYALKVRVPNDGLLKIGMYAEVDLHLEKK